MHKAIFISFIIFYSTLNSISSAQSVIVFAKKFSNRCHNNDQLLAKRVFLSYLKNESQGDKICDNQTTKTLLKRCTSQKNICNDIQDIYKESINNERGNIVGQ